jgi:hypothetical protein
MHKENICLGFICLGICTICDGVHDQLRVSANIVVTEEVQTDICQPFAARHNVAPVSLESPVKSQSVRKKCGTFYSPAYVRALAVINRSEAKVPLGAIG